MKRTKRQRSPMVHDFSRIPAANIPRSSFNLSQAYKTTFDAGYLVPFFLQEYVPGDTHSVTANILARLATPLKPVMDNIMIETFFFAVPNRLTWEHWPNFLGEQINPGDSTDYTVPTMAPTNFPTGSVGDYFGLPTRVITQADTVSALPFRAMNLCIREWFRAQDLQDSPECPVDDGPDMQEWYPLTRRGKRHDYFTSGLPWPQFGPGVDLPLGGHAPIIGDDTISGNSIRMLDANDPTQGHTWVHAGAATENAQFGPGGPISTNANNIFADLSEATATTINDLRQAFQIQKLQERDARGGHRLQELILSHFGVRGGDARLNRPEYLGGGSQPLGITQVPQTAPDDAGGDNTPQGNLAAYGTAVGRSGFTKSFTEHGYIIGFINARADLTYQKGLDRHWSRQTKYDFYWPALAKLGEQPILNKEIYYQGNSADNNVFAYQERWAEMRHNNSKITGLFRSNAEASLDAWHLSQDFQSLPTLSDEFIQDNPPIDRVIAVPDEPHFLLDAYFQHKAVRPMPVNGAPGYIDHF